MLKRTLIGGFALLALSGGGNAAAAPSPEASAALAVTRTTARVTRWLDGDTVRTTMGTVRLIGMDTPERGQECSSQATSNARRLAPAGSRITLVKVTGRDNRDRYGRLLRYVQNRANADVGLRQIKRGLADARYDSGSYGTHPRRAAYRAADARYPDRDCTPTPTPPPPPPPPGNGCDPNYTGCVPIDSDVDCAGGSGNGPSYVDGPVQVIGSDVYGLDADGDGVGCE
jgi:endonuclease YncB( thermonuclease family)